MNPVILPIGKFSKLIAIPTDRFKSEQLSVRFAVPLQKTVAQQNAMLISFLCRYSQKYPNQAKINLKLDQMYSTDLASSNRRAGDMQTLGLGFDFLGARYVGKGKGLLPEVIALMGELLFHPLTEGEGLFPAACLEQEKRFLVDAIRAEQGGLPSHILLQFRKMLADGEPYGESVIGDLDTVKLLTPAALTARYHEILSTVRPIFCYVGETPVSEVAAMLADTFGDLGGDAVAFQTKVHGGGALKREEESAPTCQGKLYIGYRTDISHGHPLAAPMAVLNEVFGGSAASKLFLNVREKMGICYHCSSSFDPMKGVLTASSGMKVENREAVEEAIFDQMAQILKGDISDSELSTAKLSISHACLQAEDTPGAIASFLTGRILAGYPTTLDAWRESINAVKKEDVIEAATHLTPRAVFFSRGTKEGEGDEEE